MKKFFNKINIFYVFLFITLVISLIHINILFAEANRFFQFCDKMDLLYFINIRQYAFNAIGSGIFPLWTTKIFCGTPFFANSETAVFYLPNIIFFFLPIYKAINLSFLLHFLIFGFSIFLWIDNKIKNRFIAVIVAIISVFNSNYYLHFYAAHLSNIITVSWFPLLLYFYDKTFEKKKYINIFPISFIISLQIFAGHFQYVYYSALVSIIYVLLFCRNKHAFITLFSSYFIAFFLTAIQLFTSYDFYLEGARRANIFDTANISIVSRFKYLLTLIFHQRILFTSAMYWETSNYVGALNIFVILIALFHVWNRKTLKFFILILFLYSLTFKTVSDFAQHIIPCFSWFRSPVKLILFINILLMPLLAYGIKYIMNKKLKINIFFIILLLMFSIFILLHKDAISRLIIPSNFDKKDLENIVFSFKIPAIIFLFFSLLLFLKKYLISKIIIIILLIIEPIIVMKLYSNPFFFKNDYKYGYTLEEDFNEQPRFLSYDRYNLKYNAENVVGRAQDKLKSYLSFMQKSKNDNIWELLRCKYIVDDKSGSIKKLNNNTLNRINFIYDYRAELIKERIFSLVYGSLKVDLNNDIKLSDIVFLEKEPKYKPHNKGEYNFKFLFFNENRIDFECNTTEPVIILYTDNYARGWKAYNIENPKEKYEILRADCIYKAISVDKGYHKIRFEYMPLSFVTGKWISFVSWIIFIVCIFLCYKKNKFKINKSLTK